MKRYFFIVFLILYYSVNLFSDNIFINEEKINTIILKCFISKDAKVNGKIFLVTPEKKEDLTDDSLKKANLDKKYLNKNKFEDINKNFSFLFNNLYDLLNNDFKIYSINFVKNSENNDNIDYLLEIEILNYNEGEYNLIRNIPINMLIKISLLKGRNIIFSVRKNYKVKSDIKLPGEEKRLEVVSRLIVSHIISAIDKISEKK